MILTGFAFKVKAEVDRAFLLLSFLLLFRRQIKIEYCTFRPVRLLLIPGLHECALFLHLLNAVLGLRLLDRLERELPGRVQLEELLEQLGHVGAFLG